VSQAQHTAKYRTHGKVRQKEDTRQTCQYAVRAPEEHTAKKKTHGKIRTLPCATFVTHGKDLAHGNFLPKKLESTIANFMGNLIL